ncbi:possible oxidoreductase [Pedobacter sp. BAL39]|uniref:SDR family NAD(P)-dependent oxidoreductase n=1 Tax=Pedobacter sp. BAL39 TaxID=391596 RepID=UPI0001559206|nr:SDR family oxidoreductase [Pedobacter sp. BAL39]EDM36109.1 possible oxidoreductase [Pedobacter sp. BAL39]
MKSSHIALVTGGSRGLGKDMALNLAKKGLDVILTYNNEKEAALQVSEAIEALGQKAAVIQLNVGEAKSFDSFFLNLKNTLTETFQAAHINFLINNAGIGLESHFEKTSEEDFDTLMNIHFKGAFFLTQKALPFLADGGGIVNISTGLSRFAFPGYAAYASMKGAIEVLTKYQAKELGERRIRVNVVAPGAIETDFRGGAIRDNAAANKAVASMTALGRVGLPEDIGGVVAFLCTDEARWINAQRIEISGGMML